MIKGYLRREIASGLKKALKRWIASVRIGRCNPYNYRLMPEPQENVKVHYPSVQGSVGGTCKV